MASDPSASPDASDVDAEGPRSVTFGVARRGYEPGQVDLVVAQMAAEVEGLRDRVAELREREADLLAALDAAEYRAQDAEARAERLQAEARAVEAAGTASDPAAGSDRDEVAPTEPGARSERPTGGPADEQPGPASDAAVATMVGEETARIVEAARHAAVEIGARAREDAERVVAEAREDARLIRADAEIQLLQRTREADDAVAERLLEAADAVQEAQTRAEAIVADAFTEGATAVLRAREEADVLVTAGQVQARELVDAAIATRDELLAELVRRRKLLRRQVEQLEAGRVRLRSAYEVVESALAAATGELDRAPGEARDAAVAAADRSDRARDLELEAAVTALGAEPVAVREDLTPPPTVDPDPGPEDTDVAAAVVPDADPVAAPAPATATAPADPGAVGTEAGTAVDVEVETGTAVAGDAALDVVDPDAPTPPDADPTAGVDAPAPAPAEPSSLARTEDPAGAVPPSPAGDRGRRRAPDPVEFEGRWSSAVRVLPPGPETSEAGVPEPGGRGGRRSRSGASATEVFARLRAGDAHQPSLFEQPPADPDALAAPTGGAATDIPSSASAMAPPTSGFDAAADPEIDPEVAWLARRDAAVAPALRALRRRLKATLADDEDNLLDAVRRSAAVPDRVDQVRDARARRDDLVAAVTPSLVAAAAAGAGLVPPHAVAAPGTGADPAGEATVGDLAVELADVVTEPLEERLERCFARYHRSIKELTVTDAGDAGPPSGPAGPPAEDLDRAMASLVSAIKAAYRARRGVQVQVPTEHAVLAAAHRGLLAAVVPGKPLRWVVAAPAPAPRRGAKTAGEPDPGSPAIRVCASCVAVADVGAGDPFGHGHLLPPARLGCRCAVAPVSAVVPRRT